MAGYVPAMEDLPFQLLHSIYPRHDTLVEVESVGWALKSLKINPDCWGAMVVMAGYYRLGWGFSSNIKLAKEWEDKAIRLGGAKAAIHLAFFNWPKNEVVYDPHRTLYFLKKASEDNDSLAQALLGQYYAGSDLFKFNPIPLNPDQSRYWLEKAFQAGEGGGAFWLGKLYYHGSGGYPRDLVEAKSWFERIPRLYARAKFLLATLYWSGVPGAPPDQAKAMALFQQAAEEKSARAQFAMGQLHRGGYLGGKPDMTQAYLWYRKAARNAYPPAMTMQGLMSLKGDGILADPKGAVSLLQAAAAEGEENALYWLGVMSQVGLGVDKSLSRARTWFLRGAEAGEARSMVKLSLDLFAGKGGAQELPLAYHWAKKAAQSGLPQGLCWAGTLLYFGVGTPPDPEQARVWLRQGSAAGMEPCTRVLTAASPKTPGDTGIRPPLVEAVAADLSKAMDGEMDHPYLPISSHLEVLPK
ncbi:MAG: sel1 repeat family protein [Magnetococcales bacterium]|nr:sel1 repeat family protein [Magnetococcales bacterium]